MTLKFDIIYENSDKCHLVRNSPNNYTILDIIYASATKIHENVRNIGTEHESITD